MSEGLVQGPSNASVLEEGMENCALAGKITREKKRERERETAEGGLANCQGKEDGWGAGGWSWRRKRYGGVCPKTPYLMQFLQIFVFSGPDPVATSDTGAKIHLSRKGSAKHNKP